MLVYLADNSDRLEALERRANQPPPPQDPPDFSEIRGELEAIRQSLPGLVAAAVAELPAPAEPGPAAPPDPEAIREIVAGGGTITLAVRPAPGNVATLITVTDEGPGIPEADAGKVFESDRGDVQALADMARHSDELFRTAEAAEGMSSFLEKRLPNYPDKVSKDLPDIWDHWTPPTFTSFPFLSCQR